MIYIDALNDLHMVMTTRELSLLLDEIGNDLIMVENHELCSETS